MTFRRITGWVAKPVRPTIALVPFDFSSLTLLSWFCSFCFRWPLCQLHLNPCFSPIQNPSQFFHNSFPFLVRISINSLPFPLALSLSLTLHFLPIMFSLCHSFLFLETLSISLSLSLFLSRFHSCRDRSGLQYNRIIVFDLSVARSHWFALSFEAAPRWQQGKGRHHNLFSVWNQLICTEIWKSVSSPVSALVRKLLSCHWLSGLIVTLFSQAAPFSNVAVHHCYEKGKSFSVVCVHWFGFFLASSMFLRGPAWPWSLWLFHFGCRFCILIDGWFFIVSM